MTLIAPFPPRITEASSIAHLDKVERGYESMDHFSIDFKREHKALRNIDFIQGKKKTPIVIGPIFPLHLFCCNYLDYVSSCRVQMMKMKRMKTRTQRQSHKKES